VTEKSFSNVMKPSTVSH